jgi:hypothetical protein
MTVDSTTKSYVDTVTATANASSFYMAALVPIKVASSIYQLRFVLRQNTALTPALLQQAVHLPMA